MALKFAVDTLEDVPAPLREHYVKEGDQFILATHGDHPKVREFRSSNIELMKERDALKTKYADIDPDVVRADRLKLAELQKAKPTERITALESELAAEKAARMEAQQQADRSRVRDVLRDKATAVGVLPAAIDILLDKADPVFTMDGDVVKAKPNIFSPTRPGEPLTPDEWMDSAIKDFAFLFGRSSGGGASPAAGGGGTTNVHELRDPTPRQLGQYASDIASGKMRVVYSNS